MSGAPPPAGFTSPNTGTLSGFFNNKPDSIGGGGPDIKLEFWAGIKDDGYTTGYTTSGFYPSSDVAGPVFITYTS